MHDRTPSCRHRNSLRSKCPRPFRQQRERERSSTSLVHRTKASACIMPTSSSYERYACCLVTLPEPPAKVPPVQRLFSASSEKIATNTPIDIPKAMPSHGLDQESATNLISEQRRQNRLLEQVIAAINTTNALLTQLVQRDQREITYDC